MPLIRIQKDRGIKHIFIASDNIADLAALELVPGERQVGMGATGNEHLAAGVSRGSANSGKLVRVITQGIISGVKTAQDVEAGDRLTIAVSGFVTPLNTITPVGAISGYIPSGATGLISGISASGMIASGTWGFSGFIASGFATISTPSIFSSGAFTGTAFNTGRVLGRALTSGLSGLGIQMLVSLE